MVDGASKDGTVDIIKSYEKEFGNRLKWISEPDDGIYYAMNKGIDMATGGIIGIINSDDWYDKDAVEKNVRAYELIKDTNQIVLHGMTYAYRGNELKMVARLEPDKLKEKGMGSHPSCFVSKEVYERIGGFNTCYRFVADYDFMLRAQENNVHFEDTSEHIANAELGGASSTANAYVDLLKLQRNYQLITLKDYFTNRLKVMVAKAMDKIGLKPIRIIR